MAQVVDYRGKRRVGQADGFQQGSGFGGEQSAVVGRQADGVVAPVDDLAERHNVVVIAGGDVRKRVAPVRAVGDIQSHPLLQPVVVVASVVYGQQAAVLGVEHEQQPVEEHQRRLADLGEVAAAAGRQRLREAGKGALEHDAREVLCYPLFVAPPLLQRALQESLRGAGPLDEGVAAEQQVERAQLVLVVALEGIGEIDLEVAGCAGTGPPVVETPRAAVGEDSPAGAAVGKVFRRRKVAQDLAVRRPCPDHVVLVAGVERQAEPLALLYCQRVGVASIRVASGRGAGLGVRVGEQQQIGDVLVAGRALLWQVVGPSEQLQHGADKLLLGDGFVGTPVSFEGVVTPLGRCRETSPRLAAEEFHLVVDLMPSVR